MAARNCEAVAATGNVTAANRSSARPQAPLPARGRPHLRLKVGIPAPHVACVSERRLGSLPGKSTVRDCRSCHVRRCTKILVFGWRKSPVSTMSKTPYSHKTRNRQIRFGKVDEIFHRTFCPSVPSETTQNSQSQVATGHIHREDFA